MAEDKIIDKIQKLLALATSSNINEAASAAARAQDLMTKHQLEMADIEATTPGCVIDEIEEATLELEKSHIYWKTTLAAGIAQANDCRTYTRRFNDVRGKQVSVATCYVGPKSALATVTYIYRYLVKEVDRLAATQRGPGIDRAWLRDFRLGAAAEVTSRLIKAAQAAKVGASGSALAVVDRTAERVAEAIAALGLAKGKAPTVSDDSAFNAGRAAGASINVASGPGLGAGSAGNLKG